MSAQHTPGPWLVKSDPIRFDTLSTVVGGVKKKAKGIERQMIVQVGGWAEWREQEANARLIAAAPEMLAALQAVLAEIDGPDRPHSTDSWLPSHLAQQVRVAVAIAMAQPAKPAEQEPVEATPYNLRRIAWELERTALGDGFYGNALRVAKDIPGITPEDRSMLDRYATGTQTGTDHVHLQWLAQQMRYAYEHGGVVGAGHLNNAWHTAMRLSKELLRLHAENERLVGEVANRNRRALEGDDAVTALANVHKYYENEVRVLTETLQRCKEVGALTAECYRLDADRDEALLRQALEALELRCGTNADERKELIPALRERLGETK